MGSQAMVKRIAVAFAAAIFGSFVGGCSHETGKPAPTPTLTDSTKLEGRAPTENELLGTWRPVELFGRAESRTAINGSPVDLRFASQPEGLSWRAYNGCNWTSAFVEIGWSGAFKTAGDPVTTLRGCAKNPDPLLRNVDAVLEATRVELRGDHVAFIDADGVVIGDYARP